MCGEHVSCFLKCVTLDMKKKKAGKDETFKKSCLNCIENIGYFHTHMLSLYLSLTHKNVEELRREREKRWGDKEERKNREEEKGVDGQRGKK